MNNKLTELRFAGVLLPVVIMVLSLSGCESTPPVYKSESAPSAKIMEQPYQETDLAPISDQPDSVIVPDYPERHVVVKGDTLWDISKKFLHDPWLWPSVWHINPEIRNPHLIYPGDVIVMYLVNGKPYITLDGQAGMQPAGAVKRKTSRPFKPALKVVKLSPSTRISKLSKSISTIPMNVIRPFLESPRVISEDQIEDSPYIVASYEEHLISGTGNRIYVRNIKQPLRDYNIVRPGREYVDPETGDVLGFEAIYAGDARFVKAGKDEDQPATLVITKAMREVLNNDLLIAEEQSDQMFQFTPRAPEEEVQGQIMSVFNGVSQIGQFMIVVLNRGENDGLAPGHVLAIMAKGQEVNDSQRFFLFNDVELPDERAGVMMVFKTYKKMSYALVMDAYRAMHVNDRFQNP